MARGDIEDTRRRSVAFIQTRRLDRRFGGEEIHCLPQIRNRCERKGAQFGERSEAAWSAAAVAPSIAPSTISVAVRFEWRRTAAALSLET